uniref:F-box domain and ankyrin repeat protein n=1 Tax=Pithovirus LCPAC304 TaxID=2506594 RepID=A0A481Z7S8_9VIRU|nr:MAG: F-box domain and ankyrin repeat protein [Pithovirus LCPAC304]
MMGLPYEVQLHVVTRMPYPDVLRFCAASKETKKIGDDDYFWKLKTARDFPKEAAVKDFGGLWRKKYEKYWKGIKKSFVRCAQDGFVERIKSSLRLGINPNIQGYYGSTALICASEWGHVDIVQMLLDQVVNIDHKSSFGWTALIGASGRGREDVVQLLLRNDADPDINKNGWTALIRACESHACESGKENVVQLLLKYGADPDIRAKRNRGNRYFALMEASKRNCIHIVRMLLERGADPDIQNNKRRTALMEASERGYITIVRLLLEYGADSKIRDRDGETALLLASVKNHITPYADIVGLLSKHDIVDEMTDLNLLSHDELGKLATKHGLKARQRRKQDLIRYLQINLNQRVLNNIVRDKIYHYNFREIPIIQVEKQDTPS